MESDTAHHRDDDRRSDLAVMGANEYKQKRRLQRILDAHDRVEDTADEAWNQYVRGEISHDAKNIAIQKAVKKAIRETYNLLNEHVEANGDKDEYWHGNGEAIGAIEFQTQFDETINGLGDFLETRELYEESWEEPAPERHGPDGSVQRHASYTVPEELSWSAYLRLKEFLSKEHDLEVRFEELDDSLPTWGFEEVEEEELPDEVEVL